MKTVLILVLSCDRPPYDTMVTTQQNTWDSIDVPGTETLYYFGGTQTYCQDKFLYLGIEDKLFNMGHKTLAAYEWVLQNKTFDYIARVHSSTYVDKKRLIEYVQTLPDNNLFAGVVTESQNGFRYLWGGGHFVLSRDVVQRLVANKHHWQHKYMEDESVSLLANWLSIPFTPGLSASIDNMGDHWRCISYGGETVSFTEWVDLKRLGHHFYRVKQDGKRWVDKFIMEELFKVL